MIDARPRFRLMTLIASALVCLLAVAGCAPKATTPAAELALTPEAEANFNYLVYRDGVHQLQRHNQLGEESELSEEEAALIRQRSLAGLDKALAFAPTPELFLEKAGALWNEEGGPAIAREALKEGLESFPDDQLLNLYLANTYVVEGRIEEAIEVMEGYLASRPDDHVARERTAQLFMEAGKDAEALDMLTQIPEGERNADALYAMGRVQGNLGMRKTAVANLKRALEMDPGFTEALVELAYQYELSKDYVAAEEIYARILSQGDPFPEARLRLISLNLKLNDPARALEVTLDGPPSKSFILDAVLMFTEGGFYAQASTALDMLTAGGEVPAEYHFYKAVIANEGENDPDKALEYLARVAEDDRLYPHALRFKAQLFNLQGRADEALDIARRGKEQFPEAAIFYILESSLIQAAGDQEKAEAVLKEGLERIEGDPELSYEMAMLYEDMGRREEGIAIMEAVLQAHPDHSNALNYVGYTLAEEDRDLERALVLVERAAALDPDNGYILDSVAWVHFKLGDLNKAWENINYAVDIVGDDPIIWEHFGDIAAAMGKVDEARRGYNKSLSLRPKDPDAVKRKLEAL